ncbi:MAG: hypothetical protein AAF715_31495, partial [Myxococcota bacterium]
MHGAEAVDLPDIARPPGAGRFVAPAHVVLRLAPWALTPTRRGEKPQRGGFAPPPGGAGARGVGVDVKLWWGW